MTTRRPQTIWFFAFSLALLFTACLSEETLATSPLIGATRIDDHGVGQVQEAVSASGYTYLRLSGSGVGVWHVVSGPAPAVGDQVSYRGYARIDDFHSSSLDRDFPHLVFTSLQGNQP